MLLIAKGYTKLLVLLNDGIKVKVAEVPEELRYSSMVLANSMKSLLRLKVKYSDNLDKKEVVHGYLQKLGWRVLQTD